MLTRSAEEGPRSLEAWWPLAILLSVGFGIANLLFALFVVLAGENLHPLFSDPDAWLFFAVTGVALLAQGGMMGVMRHFLWGGAAVRAPRHESLRGFVRLPLAAQFSTARRRQRSRAVRPGCGAARRKPARRSGA